MNIYSPLEKTYFDVTIRQHREFFNNKLQHSCSPLVIVQHVRSNESTRNLLCLFLSFSLFPPSPFRSPRILHWISIRRKNYYLRSPFAQAETVRFLKRDTAPPFPHSMPFNFRFLFLPSKNYPFISAARKQVISTSNNSSRRFIRSGEREINNGGTEAPLEWMNIITCNFSSRSRRSLFRREGEGEAGEF